MGLFGKRKKTREDCPYCKAEKPAYEVGGTPFAFGYPSVKFACCGKIAFLYKEAKSGAFLRWIKVGDGKAEWMPQDQYFAFMELSARPRAEREGKVPPKDRRAQLPPTAPGPAPKPSAVPVAIQEAKPLHLAAPPAAPAPPSPSAAFVAVATLADVPLGGQKVVDLGGKRVALFNLAGQLFAIDDTCRHAGRSLAESVFEEDGFVTCNGHGWRYDVRTGKVEHNPEVGVRRYEVKVEGDTILVGG